MMKKEELEGEAKKAFPDEELKEGNVLGYILSPACEELSEIKIFFNRKLLKDTDSEVQIRIQSS